MGDEQAVGIATAALFKLGTEPGALQRALHGIVLSITSPGSHRISNLS